MHGIQDLEILNDDFKNCCCQPVKCRMPDTITATLSGFWSEWVVNANICRFHSHEGCPEIQCGYNEDGSGGCAETVGECLANGGMRYIQWHPTRDAYTHSEPGAASLCVQNPEYLAYFPWLAGDPPMPVLSDAYYAGYCFIGGFERLTTNYDTFYVSLPSCAYYFGMDHPTHYVSTTAGDLNHEFLLTRSLRPIPPIFNTNISRQQSGQGFINASLLFDVWVQDPQESWNDGRLVRWSVDYRCNPRLFPTDSPYIYYCTAPGGIVPPKLRATQSVGDGAGIELEPVIAPVLGTGNGAQDTLWVVSSLDIVSKGTGSVVGDKFLVDFFEDPPRGGEYRDSATPQEAVVVDVDDDGGILSLAMTKQEYEGFPDGKLVYYGRILCHPNGVAIPGTGYTEGDIIQWVMAPQPPETNGTQAITYSTASAIVTEVNEDGGIVDWWMGAAHHGYAECEESHAYQGSRGLYSDISFTQRCIIRYEGWLPVRASAAPTSDAVSVCPNCASTFHTHCEIQFVPLTFQIFGVPTKLNIDVPPPTRSGPYESKATVDITVSPEDGDESDPSPRPDVPVEVSDFFDTAGSQSAASGEETTIALGGFNGNVGSSWSVIVDAVASRGTLRVGANGDALSRLSLFGTASEVSSTLSSVIYRPPAGYHGTDVVEISVTIKPPGVEQPTVASVVVNPPLVNNDSEYVLDLVLDYLYGESKGFQYPELRPLGGIGGYTVVRAGSGYAVWDDENKVWTNDASATVLITSAWDTARMDYYIATGDGSLFARAAATVDLNVNSAAFGGITSVYPIQDGFFYCLHEFDQMWRANASWDFKIGWPDVDFFQYPQIQHKNGYVFGKLFNCVDPWAMGLEQDIPFVSICEDYNEPCQPYERNWLWSFEYCPKDLLKSYEMLIVGNTNQFPNRPSTIGDPCDCQGDENDACCTWGVGWCSHPSPAIYHDQACYLEFGAGVTLSPLNSSTTFLSFGNGPITMSFASADADPDAREKDIY